MSNVDTPSDIPAETLQEKISSMVDGELGSHDYSSVVEHVASGSGASSWEQYHLIGDAMRNDLPDTLYADLSTKISAAIATEPAYQMANSAAVSSIASPVAAQTRSPMLGYAIAASISTIAIAGLYQINQDGQFPQQVIQSVATSQQSLSPQQHLGNISWSHEVKQEPALVQDRYPRSRIPNEKLHQYLVNHNEHSIGMPAQGAMLPYARLVGYERAQ